MGERLKRGQCTRLNLATKTEKEINLKFQESRKESFAVHGINLELWGLYGDLSLFPSGNFSFHFLFKVVFTLIFG